MYKPYTTMPTTQFDDHSLSFYCIIICYKWHWLLQLSSTVHERELGCGDQCNHVFHVNSFLSGNGGWGGGLLEL